ncbi:hypothetical protein [Yoonia sp. 208BN28-4]|uniref:hypothetical protein n=1 Tax=Yoonia sp. 208BN28-4 TaxID=3126505 RepID=UPI0030B2C02C
MPNSKRDKLTDISTKEIEAELKARRDDAAKHPTDDSIDKLHALMESPLLAGHAMQSALSGIFFAALHKIPDPEDWKTVFDGTPFQVSHAGDAVTTTDSNGCTVITIPVKWDYETRIIGIPRHRVFTIEETGGGSGGAGISVGPGGASGSVPIRLYQIMEYVIGPIFHYTFVVSGTMTVTHCPGQVPVVAKARTSAAWSLTHLEPEGIIGAPIARSGGLPDKDHATAMRSALLNQTPGSTTGNSKLGLRDG